MVCVECFDLGVLMRSLKSTKKPDSRFSKMVRPASRKDLIANLTFHN